VSGGCCVQDVVPICVDWSVWKNTSPTLRIRELNLKDFIEKETPLFIAFPRSFVVEQSSAVIDTPKAEFRMNLENSLLKFRAN
jgi:hypothetical protein